MLIGKLLLSTCAIYIVYRKVDVQSVLYHLSSANIIWLLSAFIVFFFSKAISAVRLNLFFAQHEVKLSQSKNLFLYLTGMFYNLFVPLIGGEAYKVYYINQQQKIPVKQLVWASIHDRLSGLVALAAFALLFLYSSSLLVPYKYIALLLIPIGYIVYYLIIHLFFKEYVPVFTKSTLLSLVVQLTQILCSWCILMSLNVNLHISDYLFIFLLSCFAYVIPVVGAREMAFVFGAQAMRLDINLSLTISLFFYLSLAVTSLSGMLFIFFPRLLQRK